MIQEKLPDNLYWEFINIDDTENSNESYDAARKLFSQCAIQSHYKWGPFSDVEIKSVVGLSDRQIWANLDIVSSEAEWILTLIDHILQPSSEADITDDTNIKIVFDKSENKIWVETKMDILANTELKAELEIINSACLFLKPESSADSSTNEDCENFSSANTKEMSSGDTNSQIVHSNIVATTATNVATNARATNSPNLTTPPNTTGGKMCKFCGISFTHQGTVEAHMLYYCARRENANSNENNGPGIGATGMPINRMQKTWRTRQRNRQNNSAQLHHQPPAKMFPINTPMDSLSNPGSFLALFSEENMQKLSMIDSVARGALNTQMASKQNPNVAPANSAIANNVLSALFSTLLAHQTNPTSNCPTTSHPVSSPPNNPECDNAAINSVAPNSNDNTHLSPSTSARLHTIPPTSHHNRQKLSSLPFCNSCGMHFSSQEIYENHMILDFVSIQANPVKFSNLVLAAPVMGQNGSVHYVPVHNFRNLQHSQNPPNQNTNITSMLVPNNNSCNASNIANNKSISANSSNLEDRPPPPSPLDLSVPPTGSNSIINSTRSPLSANLINKLLPGNNNNQSDGSADLNNFLSNFMNTSSASNNNNANMSPSQLQNLIVNVLLANNTNQHNSNTSDNAMEAFMNHMTSVVANTPRINNSTNNATNHPMGMSSQGQQRTQSQLSGVNNYPQQQQAAIIPGVTQIPLTVNTSSITTSCNPACSTNINSSNNNCSSMNSNNNNNTDNITRKYLCQHCQTRFQHSPTFKAHQEFYCQGKRKSSAPLSNIPEKRSRTNNMQSPAVPSIQPVMAVPPAVSSPISASATAHSSSISSSSSAINSENNATDNSITNLSSNGHWVVINNGFKCVNCGFIGQTRRGIRIHCKSQCPFRRENVSKSTDTPSNLVVVSQKSESSSPKVVAAAAASTVKSEPLDSTGSVSETSQKKSYNEVNAPIRHLESPTVQCKN